MRAVTILPRDSSLLANFIKKERLTMINASNSKVIIKKMLSIVIEMIFSEDAILMSLLDRGYDDEEDIKDAVLSYCNRGAVSSSAQKRSEMQQQ